MSWAQGWQSLALVHHSWSGVGACLPLGSIWLPGAAPCGPRGHIELLAPFVPREESGEGGLSTIAQGMHDSATKHH